jgi:hypothetical protein
MSIRLNTFEDLRNAASDIHAFKTEKQLERLYKRKYAGKKVAKVDQLILRMIFGQKMKEVTSSNPNEVRKETGQ